MRSAQRVRAVVQLDAEYLSAVAGSDAHCPAVFACGVHTQRRSNLD